MTDWHTGHIKDCIKTLDSHPTQGLSKQEAQRRLEQYGANALAQPKEKSLVLRLLEQMKDPMILVLLVAAGLSFWVSGGEEWVDAVIILGIVLVNAVLSISQEDNAKKALEALQTMSAPQAKVVREGILTSVEASTLVIGDLVRLEVGDLVPADLRIMDSVALKADESAMTGESLPVDKAPKENLPQDTPLAERSNLLLSGTVITNGRARCMVVATGMETQMGHIAGLLLGQEGGQTPLQKKMAEVSRTLSFACLCVCAVMFGIGLIQGKQMLDMFLTAVSLAVAAIPEGLPAVVTIVLALGVQRMAGKHAIVKRLPAVETLGSASVICSDKTGTLTQNKMTVVEQWSLGQRRQKEALTIASLCNDCRFQVDAKGVATAVGDPTEQALLMAAWQEGLDKNQLERELPRREELPFDSGRKLMSTLHRMPDGRFRLMVKGAPDVLLQACTQVLGQGGVSPMTSTTRGLVEQANQEMASGALRVLGVAYREFDRHPNQVTTAYLEQSLCFVGLIGMIDPPRPEVKVAVAQCRQAGIRPVMITGDHRATAVAIAQELDLYRSGDLALSGTELDFMPQEVLEETVERVSVYARVSPEHKMRIVEAWQKKGNIVAMTGDGVNDAPALKVADIGCAMGQSGTEVAKGASDLILTDDNFSTIVAAVAQGRGIYANIKKAVHYLLSCNIGEMITLFFATVLGFAQMPLVPVQLLWLNLVTDALPALALGVEPVEDGVMHQKPRGAGESLFAQGFAIQLVWQGVMVGLLTLTAYLMGEYLFPDSGDGVANTMAFATLTFCQLFHAFDVRSEDKSLLEIGICSNKAMNKAFVVGVLMQVAVLCFPPLMLVFHTVALSGSQWGCVLGLAVVPLVVVEGSKLVRRHLSSRQRLEGVGAFSLIEK